METRQFTVLLTACASLLDGCALESTARARTDAEQKESVGRTLQDLGRGLRGHTWQNVAQFFSPGYQTGYLELRDRVETRLRNERLLDLQFQVNRILERDGLLNVQVRWNKSFLDRAGKPGKASGTSEIVLRPERESFRILSIGGDQFF